MSRVRTQRRQLRPGVTVLELLVVIAITGVLAGVLLPAVMYARESARRTHCVNNLRQVGVAMQQHHDSFQRLPSAWKQAADGFSGYGWAVDLLPYLDETNLGRTIARTLPITAPQNDLARRSDIVSMRCPSDISDATFELFSEGPHGHHAPKTSSGEQEAAPVVLVRLPIANYAGVFGTVEADDTFPAPHGDGPIVSNRRVRLQDLERGPCHTILVGERTTAMVPSTWLGVNFHGEDAACRLVGAAITAPSCDFCDECEFASRHAGGANFAWGDGHVSLISRDIDSKAYRQFAMRRSE